MVLATVAKKELLHPHILRQHAFGEIISIPALGQKGRLAVLKLLLPSESTVVDFQQVFLLL